MVDIPCTGVILSGGQNTRMNRENKAFLDVGGRSIVERILSVYRFFFDDIILVTNSPEEYLDLDVRIVTDIIKNRCSLAGLHSGLFHADNHWAMVLACDLPFVKKDLVQVLLDHVREPYSVIIPETSKGLEALFAVYSKDNLGSMEKALRQDRKKIQGTFKSGRVYKVSEKRLRAADPDLLSFYNINRPQELDEALAIENQQRNNHGPECITK
jgi:molybdenum cofactor guanylyltransferase